MHIPSPSDYIPFDSDALAVFRSTVISNYAYIAFAILVVYDHAITIDVEVERIWTLKWGLPKVLFLTSRYVITPLLMMYMISRTIYPVSTSFCISVQFLNQIIIALSLFMIELVLLVRVSALYGHSKTIMSFLTCLFTCQLAVIIVTKVIVIKSTHAALFYEYLPGCWYYIDDSHYNWFVKWRIAFMCSDGVLLILALIKAFSYRNYPNPTIRLLARDSVLYFAPMFACLIESVVVGQYNNIMVIPTEWIACFAVSRMMLSLRSLVFNDPLSTQRLKFSTIIFQNQAQDEGGLRSAEIV